MHGGHREVVVLHHDDCVSRHSVRGGGGERGVLRVVGDCVVQGEIIVFCAATIVIVVHCFMQPTYQSFPQLHNFMLQVTSKRRCCICCKHCLSLEQLFPYCLWLYCCIGGFWCVLCV